MSKSISVIDDGTCNVFFIVLLFLTHWLVFTAYGTLWKYLREGVSIEEAKKLLALFFMGRHLVHAPAQYLERIVFADVLEIWKEPQIENIPYWKQGLRGLFILLTNIKLLLNVE
jgi:hypothetical protein